MSLRRPPSPELTDAARRRLEALRQDLLRESGAPSEHVLSGPEEAGPALRAPTAPEPDPAMPRPGRHAGRRPRELPSWMVSLAERLPAGLADRPLGAGHVAAVAVLAMVLVAGGALWALQLRGSPAAPPAGQGTPPVSAQARPGPAPAPLVELPDGGSPTAVTGGDAAAGTAVGGAGADGAAPALRAGTTTEVVVVDVAGRVRRPGLATLPVGARVADALEAAGGARRGVRLLSLNLARVLVDGEQILVGVRPPAGAVASTVGAPAGSTDATGTVATLVNLNTADAVQLETLPGVGPVTATAILDWRAEHGGFTAVEELLEVSGIGPATMDDLRPLVTV